MLKYFKNSLLVFSLCLAIVGCKNDQKQVKTEPADTVANQAEAVPAEKVEMPLPEFPAMANKIEDLIPQDYDIDLEAEGDLNGDGIKDKALVLMNTRDTTGTRTTLVLLKKNNTYSVDAISYTAVDPKYREDGYKIYDYEDIAIDSGKLVTNMQATGPSGTIASTYKYINGELVLTGISTFNMGAGGQIQIDFDLLKGIYEQTDINTMKDDMPSTTTTKKYKIPQVLFKDSDPNGIMIEAYKNVGH